MAYIRQVFEDGKTILKSKHLEHIEDGIIELNNLVVTGTLTKLEPIKKGSGFVNKNGVLSTYPQYYAKYEVIENATYYYTGTIYGSAGVLMAAFYDAGNDYIGNNGIISTSTKTEYKDYEIIAPPGSVYMICSSYTNNIVVNGYTGNYAELVNTVDGVKEMKETLNQLNNNFYKTIIISPIESGNGYVRQNCGEIVTAKGFYYNKYEVQPKSTYYFTGYLLGSVGYPMAAFYDSNGNYLSDGDILSTSTKIKYDNYKIITPENCAYMICSTHTEPSQVIFKSFIGLEGKTGGGNLSAAPVLSDYFSGCVDWATLDTDYAHIVCYGQSLSNGSDSVACGDEIVDGTYVLGSILDSNGTSLTALQLKSGYQHPIASASNVLATLLRKHCNNKTNLIVGSYGVGGQSIVQLMSSDRQAQIKSEEGYTYDCVSSGKYSIFENSVNAIASYCANEMKTISCPAIVYLQGERDYYSDDGLGFTEEQPNSNSAAYAAGGDKDKYKKYMSYLKDDMQNKVMTAYGQTTKPLFCVYQVSGGFVKNADATINMAQLEFAQENEDVILIQTPYFTPQYNSSHLSTNGYRWLGEYIGKYLFEALINRSKPYPLVPIDFDYETDNNIRIKLNKAVNGLSIDTYTVEDASNGKNKYGFTVYTDGVRYVPADVKVYGDEIILKPSSTFGNMASATSIKVIYGGQDSGGTGNIRDNCPYVSLYNYLDDSADKGSSGNLTINHSALDKDGNSIIGKKYPMYNWLCSFCYDIKQYNI